MASFPEDGSEGGGGTVGDRTRSLNVPGQGRNDGGRMPPSGASTPQPLSSCAPTSQATSPPCPRSPLASSRSSPRSARSARPFEEASPTLTPRRGEADAYQSGFLASPSSSFSSSRPLAVSAETGAGLERAETARASAGAGLGGAPHARPETQRDRPETGTAEAEAEKGCGFDDAAVYVIYPPDLFAAGIIPRPRRASRDAAQHRGKRREAAALPEAPGRAENQGHRDSLGPRSSPGEDVFDADEANEVLAVCKYLLAAGRLPDVPEWRPQQVLQGQLLQLAAIVLPTEAVLQAGPVALEEWIRKFSSLSATVDLVSADARGTPGKPGKSKPSALSCQFWEAQAFPIDTQESASVEVTPYTYEAVACAAHAPAGEKKEAPLGPRSFYGEAAETQHRRVFDEAETQAALAASGRHGGLEAAREGTGAEEGTRRDDGEDSREGAVTRIDTAMLGKAGISEDVLRQVRSERFCFIVDIRIPMTVNPQYLGKLLLLELAFAVTPVDSSPLSPIDAMRESIQIPFSTWAAAHGLSAASTVSLQSDLAAPTLDLLSVPFSSSLTGARFGAFSARDLRGPGTAAWWAPPLGAEEQPLRDDGLGDRLGRTTEILVQSLSSLAIGASAARTKMQSAVVEHRALCPLSVRRPLQVTTALMDSFMYVQIENTTEDVPLTIENVILRSVNSHAQGELPVTLQAGEQYSVLLRLDDSFLSHQAPRWESSREGADGGRGQRAGTLGRRDSRYGPSGKTVLPLCLKW
ncbi:conserved hypothetical protein [Neospora caninum Liverpool]|nr:conserved hypothetical protein [Neospora caninum Liverpool]CBZ55150.1 conserved hypothetical protein [Neospora caninum Liverpool]|eukprot:XP_003885178.1 conserved hypothetical protein [Neospora caninum Liverpool]